MKNTAEDEKDPYPAIPKASDITEKLNDMKALEEKNKRKLSEKAAEDEERAKKERETNEKNINDAITDSSQLKFFKRLLMLLPRTIISIFMPESIDLMMEKRNLRKQKESGESMDVLISTFKNSDLLKAAYKGSKMESTKLSARNIDGESKADVRNVTLELNTGHAEELTARQKGDVGTKQIG